MSRIVEVPTDRGDRWYWVRFAGTIPKSISVRFIRGGSWVIRPVWHSPQVRSLLIQEVIRTAENRQQYPASLAKVKTQ